MSSSASLASLFTWWMSVRFPCGRLVTIIDFVMLLQSLLMYWQRFESASVSIFRCFLNAFFLLVSVAFLSASGVRVVSLRLFWWSFGSSLVSSLCCLLVVGPRRFCLALLFHHIARHQPRRVSSRLSFAVSTCLFLCFFLMLVPCVVAWPCFSTSKRAISFVESFPVLCPLLVSA